MQRPGTKSGRCPNNANTPNSARQDHRPQSSPTVVPVPGRQGGIDEASRREACRSPPQRMRSRVFLQSAMDLSLVPPGLSDDGNNGSKGTWGAAGGGQQNRRPGVASAAETSRRAARLNSASCSALQPAGTGGLAGGRPSTSSAVLTSGGGGGERSLVKGRSASRGGVSQDGGGGLDADDGQTSAWGPPHTGNQVIDLGVVSDSAPRPRVWGERQLAAAAAAAGRARSDGVGGGVRAGVTKGGVVLDARFAKVRKTLRRDVLEAAERARLPLLQA